MRTAIESLLVFCIVPALIAAMALMVRCVMRQIREASVEIQTRRAIDAARRRSWAMKSW